MKLNYYLDTDSLYIDLSSKPSVDSRVISEGVVLDYEEEGNLVGIDIDNASRKIDFKRDYAQQDSCRDACKAGRVGPNAVNLTDTACLCYP